MGLFDGPQENDRLIKELREDLAKMAADRNKWVARTTLLQRMVDAQLAAIGIARPFVKNDERFNAALRRALEVGEEMLRVG